MGVEIGPYDDVPERALELGCNVPTELALLPRNFQTAESKDDLIHEDSVPTVRTLWRQAGIDETELERESDRFPYIQENAVDWIGPTIFVSASFLTGNPNAITVALGVVSNYLTDLFKGDIGNKIVTLKVVKEEQVEYDKTGRRYLQISYKGDVSGLSELPNIVREARNDE